MEDLKYYTPSIEEFYIGFEFEYHLSGSNQEEGGNMAGNTFWIGWVKRNVVAAYVIPDGREISDYYRVKYLDREDIESLGFTYTEGVACSVFSKKTKLYEHDTLIKIYAANTKVVIKSCPDDLFTFDGKKVDVNIFSGTIKNKSELIKLLNQLGIK